MKLGLTIGYSGSSGTPRPRGSNWFQNQCQITRSNWFQDQRRRLASPREPPTGRPTGGRNGTDDPASADL